MAHSTVPASWADCAKGWCLSTCFSQRSKEPSAADQKPILEFSPGKSVQDFKSAVNSLPAGKCVCIWNIISSEHNVCLNYHGMSIAKLIDGLNMRPPAVLCVLIQQTLRYPLSSLRKAFCHSSQAIKLQVADTRWRDQHFTHYV